MQIGQKLGPYEVIAKLGEGGMGEVYRARDGRLERDVALKILPASLAGDADRLMRFAREARTLAALNHPHIAQIHGVEETAGTTALVMELVDGEDLADHIARGPLAIDEALAIARQIVEALDAAHQAGIVHRDLKPANVKVRRDGTVKVLDFGLAKPAAAGAAGSSAATGATMTSPAVTMHGVILGTAAYMSPEQARGKDVDKRADIWAFGCVLYEMLSGRRAFAGDDVTDTLTAVMRDTPDWNALPAATPPGVRRLLGRCLDRDPKRRLRDIGDALADLDGATGAAGDKPAARPRTTWMVTAALVGGVALGVAGYRLWTATTASSSTPSSVPTIVADLAAPPGVIAAYHDGFALSPDAGLLAFTARDRSGVRQIWLRRMDSAEAHPIPNTEGGRYPFWSPDSAHIAFFVENTLRRVPVSGGAAQTICTTSGAFATGSWSDGDRILFGVVQGSSGRIFMVPAAGGTPERVAIESGLRPQWLPGGRDFLYLDVETYTVMLRPADGGAPRSVTAVDGPTAPDGSWNFVYSRGGYLFFNRNRALAGQRFDPASGAVAGAATALAGAAGTPNTWLSVSAAATSLVAVVRRSSDAPSNPGDPAARLRWANRQGELIGELGEAAGYWSLRLSPDGRRAAANFGDEKIWFLDGGSRRVPLSRSGPGQDLYPVWSPDGRELVFGRVAGGPVTSVRKAVGGDGPEQVLKISRGYVTDWSADGASLLVQADRSAESRRGDILMYDLAANVETPWLASAAAEGQARFSPDGRWIAYASDVSGRFEVLIGARAGGSTPLPVSASGGRFPIWRRDGRELFYLGPNDEVMAVSVSAGPAGLTLGEPARLFRMPLNAISGIEAAPYDVSPDGQRFLLNVPEPPAPLLFMQGVDRLIGKP
jgi:hypothetical protein